MAYNVISTGSDVGGSIFNSNGGTVLSGDAVKGGYFVTDSIANIPSWSNVTGTLCFNTGNNKSYRYNGSNWVEESYDFLPLSGGTLTDVLTLAGNKYSDDYTGALNLNNSNIYGVNAIYTADATDAASEGIHFYRSATTVDSFWCKEGNLYFSPNRTLVKDGTVGSITTHTLIHSGNISSQSVASATKATQDDDGNVITSTYVYKQGIVANGGFPSGASEYGMLLSRRPHVNNSTTGNDNYYLLVDSTKKFWIGTKINTTTTPSWTEVITSDNIGFQSVASANKATQDSSGNTITSTYVNKTATLVTLNGTNKTANSVASFYAPTSYGSKVGLYLTSNGSGNSPVWKEIAMYQGEKSSAIIFNSTNNTASGTSAFAEGVNTTASGTYSHAGGGGTTASGSFSYAGGQDTKASGTRSHAEGYSTIAKNDQFVIGHSNDDNVGTDNASSSGTAGSAFIIGNGSGSSSKSNALRVTYSGAVYGKSSYNASGADYAEYFEWKDSNSSKEDRRGYFVTLEENKIKIAQPGDYILGIVSALPSVIGNGDEDWRGRYVHDEFGDYITEKFEYEENVVEEVIDEETGEISTITKTITKTGTKWKENPDYDPSIPYIQRADRPEWDAVGMVGVLAVRDDGTCQVNGYCKVAEGGTATAASERALDTYRVIERVNDHIVKVILK